MELDELLELFCQGKITSEQMQEEIIKKDAYSGKEVANLLEIIVKQQKENNEKTNNIKEFFANLGREAIPTEDIVYSYHFWLGKAFKEYNMHNLAGHIERNYESNISKQPIEKKQELLAKLIYETFPIKDSDAAWDVSHKIAKEYLMQEKTRNLFCLGFALPAETFKKEDIEKLEKEVLQKIINSNIKIPKTYDEYQLLLEKAKNLEEKGQFAEAADAVYTAEFGLIQNINPGDKLELLLTSGLPSPTPFYDFCKRTNRKDMRIIDLLNILQSKIEKINETVMPKSKFAINKIKLELYERKVNASEQLGDTKLAEISLQEMARLITDDFTSSIPDDLEGTCALSISNFFEMHNRPVEAGKLCYAWDMQSKHASYAFSDLCKEMKIKDARLIDVINAQLTKINSMTDPSQVSSKLLDFYKEREEAYDFLGNKEAAQKDREARQKLLDQI